MVEITREMARTFSRAAGATSGYWPSIEAGLAAVAPLLAATSEARELEAAICLHTHFTGEPPYVGTAGLVLAVKECAARIAEMEAALQAVKALTQSIAASREAVLELIEPALSGKRGGPTA